MSEIVQEWIALTIVFLVIARLFWKIAGELLLNLISAFLLKRGKVALAMKLKFSKKKVSV